MTDKFNVKIGDRVDLETEDRANYRTMLEDISPNGLLMVSNPMYKGIPVALHPNQKLTFYYFRSNGRYAMDVQVRSTTMEGAIRMVSLEVVSRPRKQQRRESFRLDTSLKVIVRREYAGPFPLRHEYGDYEYEEEARTLDISETGMAFKSKADYDLGERLYLRVFLNWPSDKEPPLEFYGEVRRSEIYDTTTREKQIGVQFKRVDEETRRTVAKFVLIRQQTMLRQKKLASY